MRAWVLVALLGWAGVASGQTITAQEVTASALNVRSAPGGSVLGQVRRGQVYPVVGSQGSWSEIQLGGRRAWCYSPYLTTAKGVLGVRYVLASELNVRSGPSTRYRVLGKLSRGTPVVAQSGSGGWATISYEGTTAYVSASFLGTAAPNGSTSGGSTSGGSTLPRSRAGFVQLPSSGSGYYAYGAAYKRWGKPNLVYGVQRVGRRWAQTGQPRMGVGNISLENGGYMAPHSSHQVGEDVDVIPVRNDGREAGVTIHQRAYSRTQTQRLLDLFVAEVPLRLCLFNDSGTRNTRYWAGHDNHFHYRMR